MRILLTAATTMEIAPTADWLQTQPSSLRRQIDLLPTGVGMMAAAFALTRALADTRYDLVVGAGIAGAFDDELRLGECVIVQSEQQGDLGAEDHDEFLDVFTLGLQSKDAAPFVDGRLPNELREIKFDIKHLRAVSGLTVSTVSGNASTIAARHARYGAQIESMEGAALHYVCRQLEQPFLQLRAISNYVTPRDRSAWKIGESIMALNAQLMDWLRMLL